MKKQLDECENDMKNLTSDHRKYRLEKQLEKQKANTAYNHLNKQVITVGTDWRTKHETTVKKLVVSLTKFGHQQIGNLLKLEKIDKNTIEFTTKVATMLTLILEIYE